MSRGADQGFPETGPGILRRREAIYRLGGKITTCQIGVFGAYVSAKGHAFIDRALYLPKAWTSDPARLASAHVPDDVSFATKPALAVEMIRPGLVCIGTR